MYQDGFRIVGGDSKGRCISSSTLTDADNMSSMGDPTLKFNVDLSYGCTLEYTHQELEDNCASYKAPLTDLEIFKNLDNIDHFGIFGSANIYYPQDWKEINQVAIDLQRLGQATWDSVNQICKIYAAVNYEIIYAEMGFNENMQKYVVQMEKHAQEIDWHYNRRTDVFDEATEKQKFEVAVSFQFVKLQESDVEGDTNVDSTSFWNINDDIFYAFSTKSEALIPLTLSIYTAIVLSLSMTIF